MMEEKFTAEAASSQVRVRFAPSPTGALHIGGVRTALFNYLFARQHHGSLVFRIEDTDSSRFVPGAEEYILESFRWLGIHFDEGVSFGGSHGPYRQSERREIYKEYVQQLLDEGKAYYAFDTPEELEQKRAEVKNFQYDAHTRLTMRNSLTRSAEEVKQLIDDGEQYVVRFLVEPGEEVVVHDMIRGDVHVKTDILDDKVLYKSHDELPTYHLANIVDDHLMGISHVIRGEEWLPSAPLHVLLYRAFGWEDTMPRFAHLPLLLKPEGKGKLSKRDGDRLGFPVITKCSKAGAKFDYKKAIWFNHEYMLRKSDEEIAGLFAPIVANNGVDTTMDRVRQVVHMMKDRVDFVHELWPLCAFFFIAPTEYDEKTAKKRWKEYSAQQMTELAQVLQEVEDFSVEGQEPVVMKWVEEKGYKLGDVMNAFRLALVGIGKGPGMFDISAFLGKEETLRRLHRAISELG